MLKTPYLTVAFETESKEGIVQVRVFDVSGVGSQEEMKRIVKSKLPSDIYVQDWEWEVNIERLID
jgi:hypothetical protein